MKQLRFYCIGEATHYKEGDTVSSVPYRSREDYSTRAVEHLLRSTTYSNYDDARLAARHAEEYNSVGFVVLNLLSSVVTVNAPRDLIDDACRIMRETDDLIDTLKSTPYNKESVVSLQETINNNVSKLRLIFRGIGEMVSRTHYEPRYEAWIDTNEGTDENQD